MLATCTNVLCRKGLKNTRDNWKKEDNKKNEENNKCCCDPGKGNFHLVFREGSVAEVGEVEDFQDY